MSQNRRAVGIFTMPQEFPCGNDSTCCGPVGQTEEEIAALEAAIERLGVEVEVHDVNSPEVAQKHPNVLQLLRSFGRDIVPILTVGGEVVCVGRPSIEEAVRAVEEKLLSV